MILTEPIATHVVYNIIEYGVSKFGTWVILNPIKYLKVSSQRDAIKKELIIEFKNDVWIFISNFKIRRNSIDKINSIEVIGIIDNIPKTLLNKMT